MIDGTAGTARVGAQSTSAVLTGFRVAWSSPVR
jgi:hypothetical protein